MIKKFVLLISFFSFFTFIISCSSDDNDVKSLTTDEQNAADDLAIKNFLNNYYFDDLGKVVKFSESVTSNDKDALIKNAIQDPSGFWYVINPKASSGSGLNPDGKNHILIHYNLAYFTATEGGNGYSSLTNAASTINLTGMPQENPFFYKKPKTDTVKAENYYVIPSFIKGLNKFKPTNKDKNAVYDQLQGVIIVPSRLGYARNSNYLNLSNATFILNFELYKVCTEEQTCN